MSIHFWSHVHAKYPARLAKHQGSKLAVKKPECGERLKRLPVSGKISQSDEYLPNTWYGKAYPHLPTPLAAMHMTQVQSSTLILSVISVRV